MEERILKYKRSVKTYIAVWFMLMCSGTVIFNIKYNSLYIPIFVLYAFYYAFSLNNYKLSMDKRKLVIFLSILGIVLLNSVYHISDGVAYNGVAQKILYLVGTFLCCCTMTISEYKKTYENIVFVLCIIAIVLQILCILDYISYSWVDINGRLFPMGWGHCLSWRSGNFRRLSGMYIEPGMFQIIINYAFVFLIDDISEGQRKKGKKYEAIFAFVYILSVVLTLSTTGYFVLALLVVKYFFKLNQVAHSKVLKAFTILGISFFAFAAIEVFAFSELISSKFSQDSASFLARKNDILSGLKIIFNKPIWGYGYGTEGRNAIFDSMGISNISSGIISDSINFGLPLFLFMVAFVIDTTRKQKWKVGEFLIIILFFIQNMTEACLFFPIMQVFLFGFNKRQSLCSQFNITIQGGKEYASNKN